MHFKDGERKKIDGKQIVSMRRLEWLYRYHIILFFKKQ